MIKKDKRKSLGILTVLVGTFFVLVLSILLPKVNLSSRKSQAASLLDFPCQYSIKVGQTSNPTLFVFQLPWETKTPADMSGIVAGNLSDFKSGNINALRVIPGPFEWRPDSDKDWNYSYDFGSVPEVIAIGHGAYVRMENGQEINEFRYACSVWQKPTTLASTCPPSLTGPDDGVEIYGSDPILTWGSCNMIRGQQAIQLNIIGGANHPVNFTSDALITTNYHVNPQYIPLDPGARYSWKIRVCNIDSSQNCVSSASSWSFPRTFYWQTRTKSPAITSCPFAISISGNPSNPAAFDFYAPSDSVRSNLVRMDGVIAAKSDGNVQVVPGPLPWTSISTPPNMSKYSKTFQFTPQFVAGGVVTYNSFDNQISYGCGYLKLTPTPTPTPIACPWDIDGDGVVGDSDRSYLNECYDLLGGVKTIAGKDCHKADLSSAKGVVNALDYSTLITHWGGCPGRPTPTPAAGG